jgi:hypothetical protein
MRRADRTTCSFEGPVVMVFAAGAPGSCGFAGSCGRTGSWGAGAAGGAALLFRSNVTVTPVAGPTVTTQLGAVPTPAHGPLQPATCDPSAAVAVSVTLTYDGYRVPQLEPQSMPGGPLLTVPLPEPFRETVKVDLTSVGGVKSKRAVTLRA